MSGVRRTTRRASALLAIGVLVGCAGPPEPAAWSDQLCGALAPWVDAVRNAPPVNPTNFVATQQVQSAALGTALDGLNRANAGLDQVGEAPIEGADDIVGRLRTSVGELQATVAAARSEIDSANPHDSIPFSMALEQSNRGLVALQSKLDDARRGFDANPGLKTAAGSAATCQRIGFATPGGPEPTTPPASGPPAPAAPTPAATPPS